MLLPILCKAALNRKDFLVFQSIWKKFQNLSFEQEEARNGATSNSEQSSCEPKSIFCVPNNLKKKVVPKSKFWTWKSPKQYYFQVKAKQLLLPKSKFWTRKSPKRYYFQLRAKQSNLEVEKKTFFVFQAIWKKVVPKSKFWTRKSPKRYYFQLRAKQLWIEKLSCVPSNLKKK